MRYMGVDPGASGGIAVVTEHGMATEAVRMPDTELDLLNLIRVIVAGGDIKAAVEFVHSSPQMGVASAFVFGKGYGGLRMALLASGVPFVEVTPQRWQGNIGGLRSARKAKREGGFQKGRDKNVSKARAQQLFPSVHVHHYNADALLIAEWLRRAETSGWPMPQPKPVTKRRPAQVDSELF